MIHVGETTGGLDKALDNVSYFYTREVKAAIARLQGLIPPTLTVVVGGMIAWIMSSVMLPIYDLISTIQF
jgi:type IV pilus assembly protein PilC